MKSRLCRRAATAELELALADGQRWHISAMDEKAAITIRNLRKVMQLQTISAGAEGSSRTNRAAVGHCGAANSRAPNVECRGPGRQRIVIRLGPVHDWSSQVAMMERVASAVAEQSVASGMLLLHGALIARADGTGFILAGASGVGKSTACRRLPRPWQALSDDCVLLARSRDGGYAAHPWPTWSLLHHGDANVSWSVEQAVSLGALFFLRQSGLDRVEPLGPTPALALTLESAHKLARAVMFIPGQNDRRALCRDYLKACRELCARVDCYRLDLSLKGRFWEHIEGAASDAVKAAQNGEQPAQALPASTVLRLRAGTSFTPEVPRRLLTATRNTRLVRFRAGQRTFLKLMRGKTVLATANDIMESWRVAAVSQPASHGRAAKRRSFPG